MKWTCLFIISFGVHVIPTLNCTNKKNMISSLKESADELRFL